MFLYGHAEHGNECDYLLSIFLVGSILAYPTNAANITPSLSRPVLEPVQVEISSRTVKRNAMKVNQKWRKEDVPVNVRAMVLSGDLLCVVGPERFNERAVEQKPNKLPPVNWSWTCFWPMPSIPPWAGKDPWSGS